MSEKAWVLTRQRDDSDDFIVMGVYMTEESLADRIVRVAGSNKQYKMAQLYDGPERKVWRIGPEEDEGFFGNKPMTIIAQLADLIQ